MSSYDEFDVHAEGFEELWATVEEACEKGSDRLALVLAPVVLKLIKHVERLDTAVSGIINEIENRR